ncbi:unnamed protein product, partial [Sphacelaria rigidula]
RPRSSGASERDSAARRPAGPRRGADCEECNQELVQEGTQETVSRGQQGVDQGSILGGAGTDCTSPR